MLWFFLDPPQRHTDPAERAQTVEVTAADTDICRPKPSFESELVTVGRFSSPEEAALAGNCLEMHGVRAILAGGAGATHLQGLPLGGVLQVRKGDARKAAKLLRKAGSRKRQDVALPLNRPMRIMLTCCGLLFLIIVFVFVVSDVLGLR